MDQIAKYATLDHLRLLIPSIIVDVNDEKVVRLQYRELPDLLDVVTHELNEAMQHVAAHATTSNKSTLLCSEIARRSCQVTVRLLGLDANVLGRGIEGRGNKAAEFSGSGNAGTSLLAQHLAGCCRCIHEKESFVFENFFVVGAN